MTRIKKRRSGKNKTSDAQRTAAGRRRARSADKATAVQKEQAVTGAPAASKAAAPKKKYVAPKGGRRGGRETKKETMPFKAPRATDDKTVNQQTPFKKQQAPGTPAKTGKTRSAGARRVAVSRSVVNTSKKNTGNKKVTTPAKESAFPKKQGKGFAPWNKNKFKKKSS